MDARTATPAECPAAISAQRQASDAGVMRITFLNRFYWPDLAATAQQLTDLAEDLAGSGADVTVIASRGGYAGSTGELARDETRNAVRVTRVSGTRFGRGRLWGRLADYLSYLLGVTIRLLRARRPDVVVAASDPPFLLLPALLVARLRGSTLVYNAQDIYPQLASKLGLLRENGLVYRALDACARMLHARCDAVITLGGEMARTLIASGAPPDRTLVIPNGVDTAAIEPVPADRNPLRAELGLDGKFVVLYSGNVGRAHCFDAVIEAARRLRREPDVLFLFIGGGKRRPELESIAEADALPNVRFLDYLPRERLRFSLSMADVSLVTERADVAGLLLPSKTYGILASGRPLIFIGAEESDVARMVREARCGVVISPDDPGAVTDAILGLKADPQWARVLGARGREAAEAMYDRSVVAQRWRRMLVDVCGRPNTPARDRVPPLGASVAVPVRRAIRREARVGRDLGDESVHV